MINETDLTLTHSWDGNAETYTLEEKKLCISKLEYLWNRHWDLHKIFWKLSPHQCKWPWINFMSISEHDHVHCILFLISNFSRSTITRQFLFWEGFPITLKQQKNMFFPRFLQNPWKHYHVVFTACDCLRSCRQHVMSNGHGVYTRVTHLCNRFQIDCAISWSNPGLCAVNAKTGLNHLRGAHHLPLPTLCVGLHPMAQENYYWAQLTGFDAIPDQEFTSLNQSTSCCHLAESVEHVWDEMERWFRNLYQQPSEADKSTTAPVSRATR